MEAPTGVGIRLPSQFSLLSVVLDSVTEFILVHEVMSGVVGRVDVNQLHLAVIRVLQQLEYLQVVALDVKVLGLVPVHALLGTRSQCRRARSLALADGVRFAWPSEGIPLRALINLVAQHQAQLLEVDAALASDFRMKDIILKNNRYN